MFLLCSCASKSEKTYTRILDSGKCEEAALHIPDFKVDKAIEQGITYSSTGMSYVLTSAAYGVDVMYFITGGVVLPVVVCSPLLLLEGKTRSHSHVSGVCLEAVHTEVMKNQTSLGKKVYKRTEPWRCPDFSFAVENLMKLSDCFRTEGNYAKARKQLENILDEETFGGCISEDLREKVSKRLDSIH